MKISLSSSSMGGFVGLMLVVVVLMGSSVRAQDDSSSSSVHPYFNASTLYLDTAEVRSKDSLLGSCLLIHRITLLF